MYVMKCGHLLRTAQSVDLGSLLVLGKVDEGRACTHLLCEWDMSSSVWSLRGMEVVQAGAREVPLEVVRW